MSAAAVAGENGSLLVYPERPAGQFYSYGRYIDSSGRSLCDSAYGFCGPFEHGLAPVMTKGLQNGSEALIYGKLDRKGNYYPPNSYGPLIEAGPYFLSVDPLSKLAGYGLLEKPGVWAVPPGTGLLGNYTGGLAVFRGWRSGYEFCGYMNEWRQVLIPARFYQAGGFAGTVINAR